MSSSNAIAITGIGAVCGAGVTLEGIWEAIAGGRSSVGPIRQWDATRWPVQIAAELVGVDNRQLVEDRKLHKITSRTDLLGLYAAGKAIEQSGLLPYREKLGAEAATLFNDRSGIFAGSGGGTYRSSYDFFPLLTAAEGDLQRFGSELTGTINPMWLLKNPFNYDVLVAPNLYGDIISDLCAQMVGGLGFGCSANIGEKLGVFEPTHGSAPKYAGQNKVNPIATILAAKMMLDWLGEDKKAAALEAAVAAVIKKQKVGTYDMGGNSTTTEVARAIVDKI